MTPQTQTLSRSELRSARGPAGSSLLAGGTKPLIALAIIFGAALVYWVIFRATIRGVHFDEGVSMLAARSILENGYTRLPSGYIYHRAYLYHYMLAGSLGLFGHNLIAAMVPSVLLALGSLLLVYTIATRLLNRPWLGVVMIAVLVVLKLFSWYATAPRMYMTLLFLTLCSALLAWRGYVEDEHRLKPWALVAILLTVLSHEQGLLAAGAVGLSVAVLLLREGRLTAQLREIGTSPLLLGLVGAVAATAWFVHLYDPSGMQAVVMHDGTPPDRVGINLSPLYWGLHLARIEESFPYALPFVALALTRIRGMPASRELLYLALVMVFGIGLTGVTLRDGGGPRLFFFTLPIYTLFALLGVEALVKLIRSERGARAAFGLVPFLGALAASVSLGTLAASGSFERGTSAREYILSAFADGPRPGGLLVEGFGVPCGKSKPCEPGIIAEHQQLASELAPDDFVVTTSAMQTFAHLGRVDGWLRTLTDDDGTIITYEAPRDEYFGSQLVDTAEELEELARSDRRAWIIVYRFSLDRVSPDQQRVLAQDYDRVRETVHFTLYRSPDASAR